MSDALYTQLRAMPFYQLVKQPDDVLVALCHRLGGKAVQEGVIKMRRVKMTMETAGELQA
ncbi:hypothetical protein [Rheinheimera sp.]|uniref:hypothetical protein n=1 Tax=Rheinheimera sp. TaxID=1869214 RepID=UPI00307EEE05